MVYCGVGYCCSVEKWSLLMFGVYIVVFCRVACVVLCRVE